MEDTERGKSTKRKRGPYGKRNYDTELEPGESPYSLRRETQFSDITTHDARASFIQENSNSKCNDDVLYHIDDVSFSKVSIRIERFVKNV